MGNSINQLFAPHLRGQMRTRTDEETQPWAGRTTIASGSATVTVSTTLVNSNSIIRMDVEVGSAGVGTNSGGGLGVASIVSGVSFDFVRPTGVAVPWDDIVMWEVVRTK